MWPLCCVGNNLIAVSIRISSQYYIVMPCTEVATSSSSAIITYCPSVIYRSVLDVLYMAGRDGTGQYWSWSSYEGHRGSGSILHSADSQAGIVVISMQEYSSQTHASQATALVNGPK